MGVWGYRYIHTPWVVWCIGWIWPTLGGLDMVQVHAPWVDVLGGCIVWIHWVDLLGGGIRWRY